MKTIKKVFAIVLVASVALVACNKKGGKHGVALITDATGIDDKSFNASAWKGILNYYGDKGAGRGSKYEVITSQSSDDYVPNIRNAVEEGYELIVTTGFTFGDAVERMAKEYPNQKFAIIDVNYLPTTKNLVQYVYDEEQGSYLVGVAAAFQAKKAGLSNPKFGFVGGVAGATITKFEIGYIEGIKSVYPNAEIIDFYANSWGDPGAGKTAANNMFSKGCYAVFSAAGGTGLGVIAAAKEARSNGKDVWAIGVDSDQYADGIYQDGKSAVLTSMLKNVDISVENALSEVAGSFTVGGKVVSQGIANGGVGYSKANSELCLEARAAADNAEAAIKAGTIVVNKTYADSRKAGLAPNGLAAIDD